MTVIKIEGMKHNNQTNVFAVAKKYAALALIILVTFNANAQRSGLAISIASNSKQIADGKGGIHPTSATLRKIKKTVADVITATKPKTLKLNDVSTTPEKKVPNKIKQITAPVETTSTTVYDIANNTATDQYTSLQANFIFTFININNSVINSLSEIIELYKLENGSSTRSFCIPAGNCTAVNIPIQISENSSVSNNRAGAATTKVHHITIPSGYLSAGEYAFIDKSTLKADGTALVCFAFTLL